MKTSVNYGKLIAVFALIFLSFVSCRSSLKIQSMELKNNLLATTSLMALPEEGETKSNPYLAGLDYYKKGDFDKAIEEFEKAIKAFPKIEDYSLHYLFRIHEQRGEYDECKRDYETLIKKFSQSRWIEECMYRMGKVYFNQNKWEDSIKLFYEFNKRFPRSNFITSSFLNMGLSYMYIGEKDRGKEVFTFLWLYYPWSIESKEAENHLKNIYKVETLENVFSPSELFIRARKFFDTGRFRESIPILKFIFKGDFKRDYKLNALKKIAECYERGKEYSLAINTYKELIIELEKEGDKLELPDIYFHLARSCYQINFREGFNLAEKALVENFPQSPRITDLLYISGRYDEDEKRFDDALEDFEKVLNLDSEGTYREESLWHIGWIYYLKGNLEESVKYFLKQREILKKQENIDRSIYWYYKSLEKNQEKEKALEALKESLHNDLSYYGILVRDKLKGKEMPFYLSHNRFDKYHKKVAEIASGLLDSTLSEKIGSEATDKVFPEEAKLFLERAMLLREMNLVDDSIVELKYARKTIAEVDKKSLMALAEIFWASGDYYTSIKILNNFLSFSSIVKDEKLKNLIKIFYPLPYWDNIYKYSHKFGVDPFLVLAIMRQESFFNSNALSPAGAVGLLQLMPNTALQILQEIKDAEFKEEKLYDEEVNICIGTKYISNLLERYDNNLVFAIAAYNAGEHKIEEWSSRFSGRELDEFVESIPYPETKNYIKKVITNYENYYRIYGGGE